jgi:dihydroorotate dehydrogenase electron transfer subunit
LTKGERRKTLQPSASCLLPIVGFPSAERRITNNENGVFMFQCNALIMENINIAPGYHRIRLLAPEITAAAHPGQFIQIRVGDGETTDPLLARPISIYRIDLPGNSIELIYKTVGRGTQRLAGKNSGRTLEIIGPIGNGFTLPDPARKVGLIGGGVGMPPLYCFAEKLRAERPDLQMTLFYGGRSRTDLLELENWKRLGVEVYTATEDGTYGVQGLVIKIILEKISTEKFDYIAACGPKPMLRAVREFALANRIPGEFSLEAHMACGVGACLGCVCKTEHGYRRVCVDGPVFPLSEVSLDD